MRVRPIGEHDQVVYDLMIVATLERSGNQLTVLRQCGVPKEKLFLSAARRRAPAHAAARAGQTRQRRPVGPGRKA